MSTACLCHDSHSVGGRVCCSRPASAVGTGPVRKAGFLPLPLTDLVFFAQDGVSALAHLEESAGVR